MPYAPQYQPQTQAPEGSQTRLVAPNGQGGAAGGLAQGLQSVGQGMGQMAIAAQFIQERHDDIFARKLRQEFLKEVQPLAIEYSNTQGENAIGGADKTREAISKLRDQYSERAGNQRMRERFTMATDDDVIRLDSSILTHAGKAQFQLDRDVTVADIEMDTDDFAAYWDQPELQAEIKGNLLAHADRLSDLFGQTGAHREETKLKVLSQAHSQTLRAMMLDGSYNVDAAVDYLSRNRDEMTPDARNEADRALQGPKRERYAEQVLFGLASGVDFIAGGDSPVPGAGSDAPLVAADSGAGGGVSSSPASGTTPNALPARGQITSGYGMRTHPTEGGRKFHNGMDIAAAAGSSIKPTAAGVVTAADYNDGNGWFVRVKHPDGHESAYLHMRQKPPVSVGDQVTQSLVIGTVGSTGRSTGPHLHFAVKGPDGKYVDPQQYLKGSTTAVVGSPQDPRAWDYQTMYRQIDAAQQSGKMSVEQANDVRAGLDKRLARDEKIISIGETNSQRGVDEWMMKLRQGGGTFTDITQLPKSIRDNLTPRLYNSYADLADRGKAAVIAEGTAAASAARKALVDEFEAMESLDEEAFRSLDLTKFAPELGDEYLKLAVRQGKAIKDHQSGVVSFNPGPKLRASILAGAAEDGIKVSGRALRPGDPQYNAIAAQAGRFVRQRYEEKGRKPLNDAEYAEAYSFAVAEAKTNPEPVTFLGIPTGRSEARTIPRYRMGGDIPRLQEEGRAAEAALAEERRRANAVQRVRSTYFRLNGRFPPPDVEEVSVNRMLSGPQRRSVLPNLYDGM